MKNTLRSIFTTPWALSLILVSLLLNSCTKDLVFTAPTKQGELKISTRSISDIPLPYIIYVFSENGKCANQSIVNNYEDEISFNLNPGKYTIKAFANANTTSWIFPDQTSATLKSVVTPQKDKLLSNLFTGTAFVELNLNDKKTIELSLSRKLSDLTIDLNNIPTTASAVKVKISPLFTSLSIDGESFDGSNDMTIALEKLEIPGEWTATNIPIFPSKNSQVNITIFITIGSKTNSYSYTAAAPQSNKQYYIKGSYTGEKEGETRLGIYFELLPWNDPIIVNKNFGKETENGDNTNNNNTDGNTGTVVSPDLPAVGSIWKGSCIMAVNNPTSTQAEILLMRITEWQDLTSKAAETMASTYSVTGLSGWRLPTASEVSTLSATRQKIGVSSLNSILTEAGGTAISANAYYICSSNDKYMKFRFSGTTADIGSTKQFRLRLVKSYTWKKDS